jgi:hypothetical protein
MKRVLIIVMSLLVVGCSKHESAASRDSLFAQPLKDSMPRATSDNLQSGLWIDSSMLRQQPDMNVLKRFDPKQVVAIYDAYRPLRNPSTTPAQLDSFLAAQKITAKELHSVLAEGDRLGWLKAGWH